MLPIAHDPAAVPVVANPDAVDVIGVVMDLPAVLLGPHARRLPPKGVEVDAVVAAVVELDAVGVNGLPPRRQQLDVVGGRQGHRHVTGGSTSAAHFSFGVNARPGATGSRSPSWGRFCITRVGISLQALLPATASVGGDSAGEPAPSSALRPRTDFCGQGGGHLGRHFRQTGRLRQLSAIVGERVWWRPCTASTPSRPARLWPRGRRNPPRVRGHLAVLCATPGAESRLLELGPVPRR
jgi:hypothetical protein